MGFVDHGAHVAGECAAVRTSLAAPLQEIDDREHQVRFRHVKERVDGDVVLAGDANSPALVDALAIFRVEPSETVTRAHHVVVIVHLEHVAAAPVDQESAHDELRIVRKSQNVLVISALADELFLGDAERQLVHFADAIVRERVIEIEADRLNRLHAQIPIHVDPPGSGDAVERNDRGRAKLGRGCALRIGNEMRKARCTHGRTYRQHAR